MKRKAEQGVGFILSPNVNLIEIHHHLDARILSVRVNLFGLFLTITNVYAPTNTSSDSSKKVFYSALRKSQVDMSKFIKFKKVVLGDFNSTIGMQSKLSGAWDKVLGYNNSSLVETNENGENFLTFCFENNLKIVNSIYRTKRIHRGTWKHASTGKIKRLDYIHSPRKIFIQINYFMSFIPSSVWPI